MVQSLSVPSATADRDYNQRMLDYLPHYYRENDIIQNLVTLQSDEVSSLNEEVVDILNQFYPSTATWGLSRWEKICGIPTNEETDITIRRSTIMSRLRGQGTTTVALIKEVAESYANGKVSVTELNATYQVKIKFVDTGGVPTSLPSIQEAIKGIIPAHLETVFEFSWLVWNMNDDAIRTFNDWDAKTWNELEVWI